MAIGTAIDIGLGLGKLASGLLFKYTQNEYLEKINELENVISELNAHLVNLRGLRDDVPHFWDDDDGQKTKTNLDITIRKVEIQMEHAKNLEKIFRETVNALEGSKSDIQGKIDDAKGLLELIEL